MKTEWSWQGTKASSLGSQLFSEPVKVELAHIRRQSLKSLCYPLHVLPPPFVRLQVSITIHVFSDGVTGIEVPEEDVDGDTDVFLRRSRVQPQRRDKQDVTWPKVGLVRVGMGQRGRRVVAHIEDVDTGTRRTWMNIKILDIPWRIKDEFLGAPYLTKNVGHNLGNNVSFDHSLLRLSDPLRRSATTL